MEPSIFHLFNTNDCYWCYEFPEIKDGYITERSDEYYFGDRARVECHHGFTRIGSNIITCGPQHINSCDLDVKKQNRRAHN